MTIYIRKARLSDLPKMQEIVQQATLYLAQQGSPQWQNGYGPNKEKLLADIENNESYVLIVDKNVAGVSALVSGVDPTYEEIREGAWQTGKQNYLSIHRIALDQSFRGQGLAKLLLRLLISAARLTGYKDLRIDTYPKNKIMEKTILTVGFEYRGMIEFDIPHGERKAYQLVLD